ncbi:MAG: hypothetical protein LUH36_00865 [Oscillospiraceae bacterium]|nr:hypothetical protein [Oscillospiraceae bacterium]
MEDYITRAEHNEFVRRMEEEDKRQNARLNKLDGVVDKIQDLTVSVQKLAQSVEAMTKQQAKESERLEELEGRDGEMWRKVISYTITAAISIVLGVIVAQIGLT